MITTLTVGDSIVPTFILIGGAAGTGKTTLAAALAVNIGADIVDLDEVTAPLVRAYLAAHPECSEAQALLALRDERYALLAEAAAHHRGTTIAVAPFSRELASREAWSAWVVAAGRQPTDCRTIHLVLSEQEHRRRLRERGATRDAERIDRGTLPATITHDPAVAVLVLDASQPVEQLVNAVRAELAD